MASAIKRSDTWYAKWKDAFGKPQRKATTAKTKKECEALAHELEVDAERGRLGLQQLPAKCTLTLGELCDWWLEERCSKESAAKERSRVEKHVIKQPIGAKRLPEITPTLFDARLREMTDAGARPASLNKLRAILHSAFEQAISAGKWRGANPISAVPTRKVPQRIYETLSVDEVRSVIDAAGATWRNLIATALYLGLRKGELFALRKQDVDLKERLLFVRRSHGNDTVKGKKALVLPIPSPLAQYLKHAIEQSPSDLVFPGTEGRMRPEHTAMEKIFRRILSRAGIVTGYRHVCRRCAAKHEPRVLELKTAELQRCPKCNMRMWPSAIPRHMRFHDVRHTTITLLLRLKVPMQLVQRIARHSNIRLTVDTYGHLDVADLREAMETLGKATGVEPDALKIQARNESLALGPTGVQAGQKVEKRKPGPREIPEESRAFVIGAEHQIRTGDLRLGKATLYQLS
jgi:integrase